MSTAPRDFYEFDSFRLDLRRRLLTHEGAAVRLPPKAFDTLLALVRSGGRVVTKDELMAEIWPDSFVEESNLAQNVFLLRRALGEDKSEHRYIVTAPGAGYRFAQRVREFDAAPAEASHDPAAEDEEAVGRVAVLPFKPLGGGDAESFLGLGLADALIMRLSSLRDLKVLPTSAVLRFGEPSQDPWRAGRDLCVDAVLVGLYQRDGEQLRVSVQLVRVRDGVTLWAEKFDGRFTNLFAVQDSISEQVAKALAPKLSQEERRCLKKSQTECPEAFQLYVRGRYFWNRRTPEALRKGIGYAQRAMDLDPTYACAYVGLADSYSLLGAQHAVLSPRDAFPKARAAVMRALEIDPDIAEAYASLAFINYLYEWDDETAERNFLKAVGLKPNYPTAHHWYGEFLAHAGRPEESLAVLGRALELDPLSNAISTDVADAFYHAGDYERAAAQARMTLELDPDFVRAQIISGVIGLQRGEYEEAAAHLTRAVELSGGDPVAVASLAHAHATAGLKREARALLRDLEDAAGRRYVAASLPALVHVGLGEPREACRWLARAYEERDVHVVWLGVEPRFEPLRAEPEFKELLARVGPGASAGQPCCANSSCER